MFNDGPTAGRSSNILKLGSLFSGIGGIELGFERTGRFKTIWHCEIEPYPSAVLEKNFPGVVNYGDITKVDWTRVERPDVIVGGFPCQDISVAGRGAGIKEGTRSGLWSEYARAIRELQPRYVVVENVPMLARRGLTRVLGDIAALGYDAEWFTIRASDVGAPHRRERLFIIAHNPRERIQTGEISGGACKSLFCSDAGINKNKTGVIAHRDDEPGEGAGVRLDAGEGGQPPLCRDNAGVDAAHADLCGCGAGSDNREERPILSTEERGNAEGCKEWSGRLARPIEDADAPDPLGERTLRQCEDRTLQEDGRTLLSDGLQSTERIVPSRNDDCFAAFRGVTSVKDLFGRADIPEPLVRGVNDGLPKGLDGFIRKERTKALGNAVVPVVAQVVAERVLRMEGLK